MKRNITLMGLIIGLLALGLLTGCPPESKVEKPSKPTGISASAASDGIAVSWHTVSGAATYDLWKKESGTSDTGARVAGAGALATTSFTDKSGIPGKQYVYAVYAVNSAGTSEMSDWTTTPVTFPTTSTTKPDTPTGVSAMATSSSAISISWYGQTGVLGYVVYRETSNSGSFNIPVSGFDPVKDITFTDTGLASNTTYYYKVSAINGAGEGTKSATVSAKTLDGNLTPGEIIWTSDPDGTLTIINQTNYDMVLFYTTPSVQSIIGGVRSQTETTKDISNKVTNFMVGGPMVIRAMKHSEYLANINDLSKGRIEYTAFAAYGQGKKYRAILTSQWDGDYSYLVRNRLFDRGVELRVGNKNGEMIAYLAAAQSPTPLYATSTSSVYIYPLYVAYNTQSQSLSYYEPKEWEQVVEVAPRQNPTVVYEFPPSDISTSIFDDLNLPYATIVVQHNATRVAEFRVGQMKQTAQSKYDNIEAGARETFDIVGGTGDGIEVALNFNTVNGTVQIPVRFADQTTSNPKIKNGFIYNVTFTYIGTDINDPTHYTAVIVEDKAIDPKNFLIAY